MDFGGGGRPIIEIFPIREESAGEPVGDTTPKVMKSGCVMDFKNHTQLASRSGGAIPIADSAAPIRTEDGQIRGVVMVLRDVSGEKEYRNAVSI